MFIQWMGINLNSSFLSHVINDFPPHLRKVHQDSLLEGGGKMDGAGPLREELMVKKQTLKEEVEEVRYWASCFAHPYKLSLPKV